MIKMSRRTEKIASQLIRELSDLIREKVTDPRIGFVTLTDVEVSEDLEQAKVYFSVLGSEKEKQSTLKGLKSAKDYLRVEIGKRVRLKKIPELEFKYDDSIDHGMKIYNKIKRMKTEKEIDEEDKE